MTSRPRSRASLSIAPLRRAPETLDEARFDIRVTPRAGRNLITGWRGRVLHLKVAAPPADNAANAAVIELLAASLRIPKRDVTIVRGETSRLKHVRIEGLSLDEARARLTR